MSWHVTRARQRGQGLAEYALILALIAVFTIGAMTLLGGGIQGTLNAISQVL